MRSLNLSSKHLVVYFYSEVDAETMLVPLQRLELFLNIFQVSHATQPASRNGKALIAAVITAPAMLQTAKTTSTATNRRATASIASDAAMVSLVYPEYLPYLL